MFSFFNNLPNPAKIFLSFVIAGLIAAGWFNKDQLPFFETQGDKLVEVQLLIQTEDNKPIQDAKILLNTKGAPANIYSDRNGYAQIEIPDRKDVEINITKEGYETVVETISLKSGPNRNKKIKLKKISSSSKVIDYQHYTAQNEVFPLTLSLLTPDLNISILKNILDKIGIKKSPLIAQNNVFKNIDLFKIETGNERTIKEALEGIGFGVSRSDKVDSNSVFYFEDKKIKTTPGYEDLSSQLGEDNLCYFNYAPVLNSFQTANDNSKYTAFLENIVNPDDNKYGSIIQYPKLSDIDKYGKKDYHQLTCNKNLKDFWIIKIIENNPNLRGFLGFDYPFIFDLDKYNQGCYNSWILQRIAPSPYLKFIDVINNNQEPIRIESITYQSVNKNPYELTVADQRSVLFQSSSDFTKEVNISLRPENHFLIPIEFGFTTEPVKKKYQVSSDFDKSKILNTERIYVRKALSKSEWEREGKADTTQVNKINMISESLSEEFINEVSSSKDLFNLIPTRFAVGSILNVKSLKINGQNININPPNDEPTVYISTIIQGGSCPYLVVYNPQEDNWLELGTILYARKNKSLQHEEVHSLGNNISKIRIEERESEITYIDALSIVYTEPETEEVREVMYPIGKLQKVDEGYFLLHQGEAIEIDLEELIPANVSDIKLKINGYYKVLQGV